MLCLYCRAFSRQKTYSTPLKFAYPTHYVIKAWGFDLFIKTEILMQLSGLMKEILCAETAQYFISSYKKPFEKKGGEKKSFFSLLFPLSFSFTHKHTCTQTHSGHIF